MKCNTDIVILGIAMVVCAVLMHIYPQSYVEIFGFVTGMLCVAYIIRENLWNFPIGILNNIFFIVLFYEAALYADMGLQVVYILLAMVGMYAWMYGGKNKTRLHVTTTPFREIVILVFVVGISTVILTWYLTTINDSFPFLDALTTCLSLAAQWLLNFKRIENWIIWMIADVFYIWLYIQKDLNLTAVLYCVFFMMCMIGLYQWYKSYKNYDVNHILFRVGDLID